MCVSLCLCTACYVSQGGTDFSAVKFMQSPSDPQGEAVIYSLKKTHMHMYTHIQNTHTHADLTSCNTIVLDGGQLSFNQGL